MSICHHPKLEEHGGKSGECDKYCGMLSSKHDMAAPLINSQLYLAVQGLLLCDRLFLGVVHNMDIPIDFRKQIYERQNK